MPSRIAVALVHGVRIEDPAFGQAAAEKLTAAFGREIGSAARAKEALVFEPVHWAPVLEARERELMARLWGGDGAFFRKLRDAVLRVNRGVDLALAPLLLSSLLPVPGAVRRLNFATLRWLLVHFVGDAVAYQHAPGQREVYDEIHRVFASALRRVAERAGADQPLCVLAHSLGSVIASNYFYDLQAQAGGRDILSEDLRSEIGATPLEHGETFSGFYTFGSPIALWSLRHAEFGNPTRVPRGEWLNFFDRDDVIASPLQPLNDAYERAVSEDVEVSLGGLLSGWNPLAHTGYWSAAPVIDRIARSMGDLWKRSKPA